MKRIKIQRKEKLKFIITVKKFPFDEKCMYLSTDDRDLLSQTFARLDNLCHSSVLTGEDIEDCLLLLTTCRNRWYTLNAMYAEAAKWSQEGKNDYNGFCDALDELRHGVSGKKSLEVAANKAGSVLGTTAGYLEEFKKKYTLYFERFEEVRKKLLVHSESIEEDTEKRSFRERFFDYGNGPDPPSRDEQLEPPPSEQPDDLLEFMLAWFGVTRPLTSLTRTYISEVLECGAQHEKTFEGYLVELQAGTQVWDRYGYKCPELLPREAYCWRLKSARPSKPPNEEERVLQFIKYCEEMCKVARRFLEEKLPGENNLKERFPLKKPIQQELAIESATEKKKPVEKTREITIYGGDYIERAETMKLGDIKNYGQINIADRIDKIVFKENLGISKEDFDYLKEGIKKLPEEKQTSLKGMLSELITCDLTDEKQSIFQKIKVFLEENGVPIAQSLTAAGIFELAKRLFEFG